MGKGDVTLKFDAQTATYVQACLKAAQAHAEIGASAKKMADQVKASGDDAARSAQTMADRIDANSAELAEAFKHVGMSAEDMGQEFKAATNDIEQAADAAADAAKTSADNIVSELEREGFAAKLAADALDKFRERMAATRDEAQKDFPKISDGAETMGRNVADAAKGASDALGGIVIAGAAALVAIKTLENEEAQIEERAKGMRDRNQTIAESLSASGQQGFRPDGETVQDYVKGALDQGSKNAYPSGRPVDVNERARLYAGISGAVGLKATVDEKLQAQEQAAQAMASGASEDTAIQTNANVLLLKAYGAAKTPAEANKMSRDLTPAIQGILTDRQAQILSRFDDEHKPQGVALIRNLAMGGETSRVAGEMIDASEKEITPEKRDELLIQAGRAALAGKDKDSLKLLPDSLKADAIEAALRKRADDEKVDADKVSLGRQERRVRDAAEDADKATEIGLMKPARQKKAQADEAARISKRSLIEQAADQAEQQRLDAEEAQREEKTSFNDAGARELYLSNVPPEKRLQMTLDHPLLAEPKYRASIEELNRQKSQASPSADESMRAYAASSSSKSNIEKARSDAMHVATQQQTEAADAVTDAVHEARKAVNERESPITSLISKSLGGIPFVGQYVPDLSKFMAFGTRENDAAYAYIRAKGLDKKGITSPDQLNSDQQLEVLHKVQSDLGVPNAQPIGGAANQPVSPATQQPAPLIAAAAPTPQSPAPKFFTSPEQFTPGIDRATGKQITIGAHTPPGLPSFPPDQQSAPATSPSQSPDAGTYFEPYEGPPSTQPNAGPQSSAAVGVQPLSAAEHAQFFRDLAGSMDRLPAGIASAIASSLQSSASQRNPSLSSNHIGQA